MIRSDVLEPTALGCYNIVVIRSAQFSRTPSSDRTYRPGATQYCSDLCNRWHAVPVYCMYTTRRVGSQIFSIHYKLLHMLWHSNLRVWV